MRRTIKKGGEKGKKPEGKQAGKTNDRRTTKMFYIIIIIIDFEFVE